MGVYCRGGRGTEVEGGNWQRGKGGEEWLDYQSWRWLRANGLNTSRQGDEHGPDAWEKNTINAEATLGKKRTPKKLEA